MIAVGRSADDTAAGTESFPLTEMQKFMLPTLTDPDCVLCFKQFFYQVQGIRIKPGISPRRLERGLKKLVKRHDMLRLVFRKAEDGEWRGVFLPPEDIKLTVEEYKGYSDAQMRARVREIAD